MQIFEVLSDSVRRRILDLLADGEQSSGNLSNLISFEFGISQPAVSQHLKVLRESNFAFVHNKGAQRIYSVNPVPLKEVDLWLAKFRQFWLEKLDKLVEEIERGKLDGIKKNNSETI